MQHRLDMSTLEDRVLFSAGPLPVDGDVAVAAEGPLGAEPVDLAHMAELLEMAAPSHPVPVVEPLPHFLQTDLQSIQAHTGELLNAELMDGHLPDATDSIPFSPDQVQHEVAFVDTASEDDQQPADGVHLQTGNGPELEYSFGPIKSAASFSQNVNDGQLHLMALETVRDNFSESFDITSYASSNTQVRFHVLVSNTNDTILFDNVQIEYDAAMLVVDTTSDVTDGDTSSILAILGDKGSDGLISLREAIIATNNTPNGAGADQIILPAGTYLLNQGSGDDNSNNGDLDVNDDLIITGANARTTIIDGNGLDRVFQIRGSNIATMTGITIQGGNQSNGGGIFVDNSSILNLSNATLTGNNQSGAGSGGAIHVHGTANLDRVLLSGNTADKGGAIGFHGADGGSLTNVTISGNTTTDDGGGLWTDVLITMTNSTIAFNTAPEGGGVYLKSGGDVTLVNSILHNPGSENSNAALTSGDFNFDSDGTALLGGTNDQIADPLLNALADNGGPTNTHALQLASPAIDPTGLTGAPGVDQRGIARDATPDIGAFELIVSNTPPTITSSTAPNIDENLTVVQSLTATDPDLDSVTFTISGGNDGGKFFINGSDQLIYSAAPDYEIPADTGADNIYEVEVTADDGNGGTDVQLISVTVNPVNDEQVLATNLPLVLDEGATGTIGSALLSTTDVDNTPAQLVYTVTSGPANGSVLLSGGATASFTQADIDAGLVTYQHDDSETTSDSFDFSVDDGQGTTTSATFSINVAPVNDEQVLATNLPLVLDEGATGAIGSALLSTTDADNTPVQLVYTVTSGTTNGSLLLSGGATASFTQADIDAGLVTYQHDDSETISDSFDFSVDDGQGTTTSATFSITVTPVNDEQVLATNQPLVLDEGATGTIGSALLSTTDADNTPVQLVYTVTSGTTNGSVQLSGGATASFTQADIDAGLVTYQHDNSETVSDSFDFTVDDGQGTTTSATFSISVTPVNDQLPTISPIANQLGTEDTPLGPIGFTIGDPDTPVGNLIVTTASSDPVLIGSLAVGGSGASRTLTITPATNQNGGPATVFVTVSDGVNTTTETLQVFFTSQNDAPVARDNVYKTVRGKLLSIAAPGILENDLDVDGDSLTAVVVAGPSQGVLIVAADGSFRYQPKPGFIGIDRFDYFASDGLLPSKVATVQILVEPDLVTLPPDIEPPTGNQPPNDDEPPAEDEPPANETEPPLGNNPPVSETPPTEPPGQNPVPENPSLPIAAPLSSGEDSIPQSDYGQTTRFVRSASVASTSQIGAGLSEQLRSEVVSTAELEDLRFVAQAGAFWDDLDELEDLVDESGRFQQLAIGSTLGITSGLSAGYVLWLIRGGYLVSSLLAQMPAWRYIDPLPVLEYINNEQDDDLLSSQADQESLESIIETADH